MFVVMGLKLVPVDGQSVSSGMVLRDGSVAPGRFTPEFPGVGLIVGTEFTAQGLTTLSLRCIATDNKVVAYQARPCGEERARSVLTSLHPDVVMEGKTGFLEVRPITGENPP